MMNKMIILVVAVLGLASIGSAQLVQLGQCETINLMQNFNVDTFATGTWYEIGRASTSNAQCSNLQFTTTAGAISLVSTSVVDNFLQTATGTATHTTGTAQLSLQLPNSNPTDFWILNTDYNNYAIAINCVDVTAQTRSINVWQLGRATNSYETQLTLAAANTALGTINLSVSDLQSISHTTAACTQLPVITPGQPVILSGQCDTASINVVQNFNIPAFTGTWHEISSYYSANAVGTCARANYQLVGSTVNVVNSQVLSQQLDTITGTATLIGNDGAARLNVVLDVQGVPVAQELLIIATDYNGFAVSYSCSDIGNNQRQVNAWILSRSRQLSAESQIQVNQAIASLVDLNDAYFQNTDQSDTGCFYFPVPQTGVPVFFPGQCDNSIAAVPAFNLAQFTGTWHEIETYPKEEQTGSCVNHVFSTGTATTLNLVSNQVVNQAATSVSGNVVVDTNDGTGRLWLTITSGGQVIEFPYWVLATDYNTYALVYSCVNVDSELRAVYSWKLSRSQTLPAAAATPINNAIAAVQVLDQRYYDDVDQSDNGCFYFPTAQPGVPVVFPGQCDTTIPVQANFDPVAYMGLWHDIQSYPSTFQEGTCNNAFYTLSGSVVDVFNTQVINQQLDTINGTATIPDPAQPAKLLVSFPIAGSDQLTSTEYWVLATDYTTYSLVYSCANFGTDQRMVFAWKLSRTKELPAAANAAIDAVISTVNVLDSRYFVPQDQTTAGCFYFPEPQEGVPVVFPGQCDNSIAAVPAFNLAQFVGTWHEIEAYPKAQQTGTCVNHAFSTGTGNTLNLVSNQVVNQAATSASGSVTLDSTDGTGRLWLTLTTGGEVIEIPYWILATDYNTYALAYSCVNVNSDFRAVHSWKLSRTQTLPAAANAPINAVINAVQVLGQEYFDDVDQSDNGCFYFPTAQPGVPVVFPGQCDTTIPVQANFDPVAYMGLWHDIQSYPSTFQEGTCNNAFYTLTESGVDVFNTQVINQQLDTINGTATIPDPAQPAKLLVSFPIAGSEQLTSTEYWVLATDYTTYSLVYSCANFGTDQRMVFAWKLSRTKELPAAANAAIDAVIGTVNVLDSRYFVPQDQTTAGCFYFPEPQEGVPVVFPGQCDNSIAAVPAFNLAQFVGTWHEIEAYPKAQQTGTCVNHAFSTGTGNTLNLVSNQVVNQAATSASGSVTLDSTDGTGRLWLTLTTGGEVIEIPYWILATDYNTYALAYSCVNVNSDFRAVHSWKLSRTQTLPPAANAPINAAINAVQVLGQEYFDDVDQSDNGCFYFPTAQPGVPVVFPGQCDTTIPVQANFDPVAYMGLWHDIQSYPSTFQEGTCNNAFYTLTESGVDVFNTQVINQQLDTINGTATIPDPTQPAKLLVSFPIAGSDQLASTEYWVLATDYTTYSLVYSCANFGTDQRMVFAWKLSRTKELPAAANTAIDAIISTVNVLDSRYFVPEDQTTAGCFYFPEPQEGVPVVFPGQCDNSIAAVPAFNLAQFVGTWHEIEAYPKAQQTGTCVNHAFSTGPGNSLNLVSNQVVNQAATSASGSVTLDSTDGTGRLWLTLTTGGQVIEIPYWILATDYNTYALAYSCVNLNSDFRAVHSWKLSRTQTLPAAANAPINAVINAVQVLGQEYFDDVDQSDNGCFYFPTAQPGVPVVFPGQCDSTIPVQANFDPVSYMGLWHDIQSYPSTFQEGTCNNAFYTLTGSGVDVFNTQVINQQLDTINGTAIIPDPTQPAKLLVTFPIAGSDQLTSTEYWVLATDYTTYSLVYSCANFGTDQRMVFAWKLSRTKELPAAANAAIDAIISTVNVLDNRYFVPEDQTTAGCFYFPEPQEDVPVVFPGQCDNSIAAVSAFNLAQFVGTWHEIEAYPKAQQTGTCVNHAFSTGTGNTLNLVSNQVVNQIATSASGSVTLDSTDGTGRLRLTLTTGGQVIEIPYWILATDYNNYALAYSCVNINSDFRAVHSWKLSRTQTLPAVANAPINAVINAVQVLGQEYFYDVDQSEAGCESYPDIPAGEPIILQGQCGAVSPVTNFQAAAFAGTWHEAARYSSERQTGACAAKQFTSTAANTFTLTQTIVYNERQTVVTGPATLATDGSGTLTATLSDGAELTYTTTIYILDTDYDDYALLYSCENVQGTNNRQIFSWKLSRSQDGLSQAANDRISEVVAISDLVEGYYQTTGQSSTDCFYYPDYTGTPDAIILPGTCPTVSGVPNFNPLNYVGNWYDVARYPIDSQFGSCPTAEYSLVDGVITIRNTMVVDGALRVQSGIGRLSATGTGLIQATFESESGEDSVAQYFILGTDYTSFSLVYSCSNVGDGTSQVTSWKLSRTPTLTDAANAAINAIISSTQGLLEDYYQSQSHSDQDCFYVPEPVPGQSVLFRGGCGEVSGMPGFTPAQYVGWWHEIERYPTDESRGQCTSVDFQSTGVANSFNVVELGVYDGIGNETVGNAVVSADGSIVITRDGETTRWTVLDTDYNTYSLLYSCEEVTTSWGLHRRVWSAKHSLARSLTPAAQTAMNPFIEANPVLHSQLYEPVDQTNSVCFHYRDEITDEVILPGQCDTTIPVQVNFDMSQFAGTWYQMERYPYPQVSNEGTCVGTRYTVDNDGVAVQNWEVLDGDLNTIQGRATVDGASLEVTLPEQGGDGTVTTTLQVLITDYEDYAFCYTCTNIGNFRRSVGAFKLSRNRTLSNEGQYRIERYMDGKQEFHQPYFISVLHNDDCQEPSSALLVKSSIIIMLVCVILQLVM